MDEFKVLMVDDDEVIAQSTAEYFNMFDVKTAYVTSFEEAVTFLSRHEVSLLLLDINLGDKSGFDLCKKVREDFDMPIFFISARSSDDDVLIALNIGGDDYINIVTLCGYYIQVGAEPFTEANATFNIFNVILKEVKVVGSLVDPKKIINDIVKL